MYAYVKNYVQDVCWVWLIQFIWKTSNELAYSFPMDAPFKLICGDSYKARDIEAYHWESILFIFQYMLTGFAVVEGLTELNILLYQNSNESAIAKWIIPHIGS